MLDDDAAVTDHSIKLVIARLNSYIEGECLSITSTFSPRNIQESSVLFEQ